MIRIGYFCSAGFTEVGGINQFLQKINSQVKWVRCFPAVNKPAPKKGRFVPTPVQNDSGITGQALINRMLKTIKGDYFESDGKFDCLILIDDLDCRFNGNDEALYNWVKEVRSLVNESIDREIYFLTLFASPEIESWFWANWSESFSKEYPTIEVKLRQHLNKKFNLTSIEDFGGPLENGSCKNKISEVIQQAFLEIDQDGLALYYSKKTNGGAILKRIDPEMVARECTKYFAPVYRILKDIV